MGEEKPAHSRAERSRPLGLEGKVAGLFRSHIPGKALCGPRPGGSGALESLRSRASLGQPNLLMVWDMLSMLGCRRDERPVVLVLMTDLFLLQGKGHRESEGPKSCRRPSNRSPTRAEKHLSFESVSSLPEVSGQQVGLR